MANTYSLTINALDTYPAQDSLSDVIYNIHWGLIATSDQKDSDGNAYTATSVGTQVVGTPDPNNYITFDSLTQSDVVGWLEASDLDIDALKASLDTRIAELITPTSVTKDVPW